MTSTVDYVLKSITTPNGNVGTLIETEDADQGALPSDPVTLTLADSQGNILINRLDLGAAGFGAGDQTAGNDGTIGLVSSGNNIAVAIINPGNEQAFIISDNKVLDSFYYSNDFSAPTVFQSAGDGGFSFQFGGFSDSYISEYGQYSFTVRADGSVSYIGGQGNIDIGSLVPDYNGSFYFGASGNGVSYSLSGGVAGVATQSVSYFLGLQTGANSYFNGSYQVYNNFYQNAILTDATTSYQNGTTTSGGFSLFSSYQSGNTITNFDNDGRVLSTVVLNEYNEVTAEMQNDGAGGRIVRQYDAADGILTNESDRFVDGSHIEKTFSVGKPYVEQDTAYASAQHEVSVTRYYGDSAHTIQMKQSFGPNNSSEVNSYDTSGRETSRTMTASNGSKEVVNSTYAGTAIMPSTVADYFYNAGNQLLSIDTTNANGTHTEVAKASGVTLTSASGVADSFTSAGSDTFIFKPASGQDLITSFRAGSGASHDTVDLTAYGIRVSSGESSIDVLASALKQVGQNTILTITPTDSITLKNVQVASLTSADFKVA